MSYQNTHNNDLYCNMVRNLKEDGHVKRYVSLGGLHFFEYLLHCCDVTCVPIEFRDMENRYHLVLGS